ncbi:glycosyltransferase family protein [Geomicrobium sediminis]|uniref:Glycosyltransferase involved in cell wall biosynthesis n=1 Tax=Geomicrobium sediminis TaxID=1347788 RepID=A0ABS2P818_9BACL|nr:glycosyltransferase [Geomicrobium sediminis]MBM7631565.1 glycosyltransferase involved in cell wall biosynthesis [Geomicrobium sediminis]
MRVLHLPYGIGMSTMAKALRTKGIDAQSWSLRTHHYAYMADERIHFDQYKPEEEEEKREAYLQKALKEFDVFHFHFGESFFPDRRDLETIKKANKKMIVHHRGSEVRMLKKAQSFNNPYVRVKKSWPEDKVKSNLEFLSHYFDQAIVNDYELYYYVEPYYKSIHVVPHTMDLSKYTPTYPKDHERPLVVHAPSRRDTKGTQYVLPVLEKLKDEGVAFDYELVEGKSHEEALDIYKKATVIVDQLQLGAYGHLSMEAMALGKPVICYIRDDLVKKYPKDMPIVSADPKNFETVLRSFLKNSDQYQAIGKAGRSYAEHYHSFDSVANKLITIYNKL